MKLISYEGYGLGTEKYQQNEYIWILNISVNNIIIINDNSCSKHTL